MACKTRACQISFYVYYNVHVLKCTQCTYIYIYACKFNLDNGIFTCIMSINGPDGILGSMLKVTANATFSSVTALFKKSVRSGIVPIKWKEANRYQKAQTLPVFLITDLSLYYQS